MLYHHDSRDYDVAASQAATKARAKLEAQLAAGVENRNNLIRRLVSDTPVDALVDPRALQFNVAEQGGRDSAITVAFEGAPGGGEMVLRRNAVQQLAGFTAVKRAGGVGRTSPILRTPAVDAMLDAGPWGRELLAENLATIFANVKREHVMIRAVGTDDAFLDGEMPAEFDVRSVLSANYKRFDSAGLLEATLKAGDQYGALPVTYHYDQLRWTLKLALPHVFEPVPNEVMTFGLTIGHSDHGRGALEMQFFSRRLWCTNDAIAESLMRRVHLGKLQNDVTWSAETQQKATELLISQVNDVARLALGPDRVHAECERIKLANEAQLSGDEMAGIVDDETRRAGLPHAIREDVKRTFNTPDVHMLPPGNTMWRLAQTFGLVAQKENVVPTAKKAERAHAVTVEERLKLETAAGRLLDMVKAAPKVDVVVDQAA